MLVLAWLAVPVLAQATSQHIRPELVAESATPAPGGIVTLAVNMRTEAGWHGYWINPGEAGFAPRLAWTLPKGVTIGTVAYPVPQTLSIGGLMNHVFEADHALLLPLTIAAGMAKGTHLPIRLKAAWLACTDKICVPEQGEFAIDLVVGDGTTDARARFDAWRAKLPAPLNTTARFAARGQRLRVAIPYPANAAIAVPHFFSETPGLLADAAPQRFSRSGDAIVAELSLAQSAIPTTVRGVLAIGDGRGLALVAQPGAVPAAGAPIGEPVAANRGRWAAIVLAIGGAVLGGLILNVMPCVFPILSLKALSLAKAGNSEGAARRDALGYAAGAMLVCVALGMLILALRAGGSSVGWAFQLQDPRVIVALIVLVTAIALNLAGLFELPSFGGGLATGNSVATGALAAFVATPCTGPWPLSQPSA